MGFFTPQHGNYEVSYQARKTPFIDRNQEPAKTIIVEANDPGDAKRQAEKQLKVSGYHFVIIEQVTLIHLTPRSRDDHKATPTTTRTADRTASPSSAPAKRSAGHKSGEPKRKGGKLWLLLIPLIIGVILVFTFHVTGRPQVEGTYYLQSISGNVACSANSDENYCVLEDNVCTLYFALTEPAGSSVHAFPYTGNSINNIAFDKGNIGMDRDGCIVIEFNYGNGLYNVFTYQKR